MKLEEIKSTISFEELLSVLPDAVLDDTQNNKKAGYIGLVKLLRGMAESSRKNEDDSAAFLLALALSVKNMSFEVFEHYRAVQDLYREEFKLAMDKAGSWSPKNRERLAKSMDEAFLEKTLNKEKYEKFYNMIREVA